MARLSPPKSAIGGRIDHRKVKLGSKIHHKGELNKIAMKDYGETYFELGEDQRHRILRTLKRRGEDEGQILGKLQIQEVFRKNKPDHVKRKAEEDRNYVMEELFHRQYVIDPANVAG